LGGIFAQEGWHFPAQVAASSTCHWKHEAAPAGWQYRSSCNLLLVQFSCCGVNAMCLQTDPGGHELHGSAGTQQGAQVQAQAHAWMQEHTRLHV
jgi:hypothetical protein